MEPTPLAVETDVEQRPEIMTNSNQIYNNSTQEPDRDVEGYECPSGHVKYPPSEYAALMERRDYHIYQKLLKTSNESPNNN